MNERLKEYETLRVDGMNPFEAFRSFEKESKQMLECMVDVRRVFGLSVAEAKEVMIICTTESKSLHEHQGKLAEALESALEGEPEHNCE